MYLIPLEPSHQDESNGVIGFRRQDSASSALVSTLQSSADNSAKCTKVFDKTVIDQDNIITPSTPQNTDSTSSPPPVNTNASPFIPAFGSFLDDSQHFPSNSANKEKSVEILPSKPKHIASLDMLTAAIQFSSFAFMLQLRQ
ncbi:hypothetical protein RIR_jg1410.t1 [Rhizophagus irregularis DAOM 181602=DAOM 197198]|nr:hypothetical protein RIR_jg1410.t1 [Rhizophagus irregularis DAOM 181602=DAOM 197198]